MASTSRQTEFLALWSAHSRQIYSYVYALIPNCNDADDIFQETSLTLLEKFDTFRPGTSFSAWACRVAYFKCLQHLRARPSMEFLDEEVLKTLEPLIQKTADRSEERFDALGHCMALLPTDDRKLVDLRYVQDLSVAKIAERVERDPSGIYKSLARIHDVLFECIRRQLAEEVQP